jgi:hypothetical protein
MHCQTIGHSENVPWPNLKKLILPESTTAITMIFFPAFNAMNGFGWCTGALGSILWREKIHENSLWNIDTEGMERVAVRCETNITEGLT